MAWMSHVVWSKNTIDTNILFKLIKKSEHIFELGIYASMCAYLQGDQDIRETLTSLSGNKSLEIQTIVLAQLLCKKEILSSVKKGNLFDVTGRSRIEAKSIRRLLSSEPNTTLGFPFPVVVDPNKQFFFQLKLAGDDIVMVGSMLNGYSFSVFTSKRSAYYRVLKTLLKLHASHHPENHYDYPQPIIEASHTSSNGHVDEVSKLNTVKKKEFLKPLCKYLIDDLLVDGYKLVKTGDKNSHVRTITFRSAIDQGCFNSFSESKKQEIIDLVQRIITSVNK